MNGFPAIRTPVNHVEPSPRRVRGFVAGQAVFDTLAARYVWERPAYPQFYIPKSDVRTDLLVDEHRSVSTERGTARMHGLRVAAGDRPRAALVFDESPVAGVGGTVRFQWWALDAWFEEDEQIFVHPRDPYTRVDAVRSTRPVRVELAGVELASCAAPVMVFETGLPTRYYLDRTDVRLDLLERSTTETACPYKGTTGGYWSAVVDGRRYDDIAWCYDFPTRQLLPIAGLIAFYHEKTQTTVG